MSDDLISRSALINKLEEWCGKQRYLISNEVWNIIKEQPTSYNVDVVIEEIKDCGTETCASVSCNEECSDYDHGLLMKTLVEIVRNGGKA